MIMKTQILETWNIHHSMNQLLLDGISDEGLVKTLNPRGRNVYQQLVHIHNVRVQWLEVCAADLFKKNTVMDKDASPDRKLLKKLWSESASAIEELLSRACDADGKIKGYKKGAVPFLGYLISHESHHRGNILLTLKQTGEKIPDAVKWGIWEWGK
jgi:uncharacterized damage-inducible protein DinB